MHQPKQQNLGAAKKAARTPAILMSTVMVWAALSACASSDGPRDFANRVLTPNEGIRGDIEELQRRVVSLQRKAAVAEVEINRLKEEIDQLRARPSLTTVPPGMAREILDEVAATPGSRSRVESSDLPADDPDLQPPPAKVATDDIEPLIPPASPADAAAVPGPISAAAQAIYDRGYSLFNRGEYLEAETSFLRFLEAHPASTLSDNAHFWIGESRYARSDFRGALAAFVKTVDGFPEGNKVPDALLKAGQALEMLDDPEGARARYLELQRRFPETAAALTAEERVEALD